jgi:hypothetical protein
VGEVALGVGVAGDENLFCPGQPGRRLLRPKWWQAGHSENRTFYSNGKLFWIRHSHRINLGDFSGEID